MSLRPVVSTLALLMLTAGCSRTLVVTDGSGDEPRPASTSSMGTATGTDRIRQIWREGGTPLIRTDLSDDAAWARITDEISKPVTDGFDDEGYAPYVVVVDDRSFESATGATLADSLASVHDADGYVILADARAMKEASAGGELTLAYVDLSVFSREDAELFDTFPGRTFRTTVPQVASIEANLSLANVDFSGFADSVDRDGVYRGDVAAEE